VEKKITLHKQVQIKCSALSESHENDKKITIGLQEKLSPVTEIKYSDSLMKDHEGKFSKSPTSLRLTQLVKQISPVVLGGERGDHGLDHGEKTRVVDW